MGPLDDLLESPDQIVDGHRYWLASGFAVLLFCGSILNWALNPTRAVLEQRDTTEYEEQNLRHGVERATRETASPIQR